VSFAFSGFASAIACATALLESFDPSVATRRCLYMGGSGEGCGERHDAHDAARAMTPGQRGFD
jgi:hypothetical protein